MTRLTEGQLTEIEQRAYRLACRSLDEDGNVEDFLGTAVSEDVERLTALVRHYRDAEREILEELESARMKA